MARVTFDEVFVQHPNHQVEAIRDVEVAGHTFGPGMKLWPGTILGGIDFVQCAGCDLEVEPAEKTLVIKGVYRRATTCASGDGGT